MPSLKGSTLTQSTTPQEQHHLLKESVYRTLVYFDLFDFAPTLLEIEKWLLKSNSIDHTPPLSTIQAQLENDRRIDHLEGFYFLHHRSALVQLRKEKYNCTDQKWKHAKKYIRLLAMMPYVEAIWLANSMGWGNANQHSDIDLLIITSPNHIWSARFFTTGLMKFFRQRPDEQEEEKAICLSLYLSAQHLSMEEYKIGETDIHYSFWATQFYPVYENERNGQNEFENYKKTNLWLKTIFTDPKWTIPILRRTIHQTTAEYFIKRFLQYFCNESLLKRLQITIMPETLMTMANRDNRVVMNDSILKLHTNDTREEQQREWEKRIRQNA